MVTDNFRCRKELSKPSLVCSVVFGLTISACCVFGYSYDVGDSVSWVKNSLGPALLLCVLMALLLSLLCYGCFMLLDACDGKSDSKGRFSNAIMGFTSSHSKLFLFVVAWIGITFAWMVWLFQAAPGATDSDTVSQLLQYYGLSEASNHHPWFDTLIFGFFWDIGLLVGSGTTGLFLYCCLQVVCLAAGLAMLLVFFLKWGGSPTAWFVLLLGCALYFPLPMFATIMMKDSLNAVFWLPWITLFMDIVLTRAESLAEKKYWIPFIVVTLLCCLTKKTCLYIILPSLILLLFVCSRQRAKIVSVVLVVAVGFFLWEGLALSALGIPQKSTGEMMSIPSQQVARCVKTHGISQEDDAILEAVFRGGGEKLAAEYVPRRADNSKGKWRSDSSLDDKLRFLQYYLGLVMTHPSTCISATWNNTYDYFYPAKKLQYGVGPAYNEKYVEFWKSRCFSEVSDEELSAFLADMAEQKARLLANPPVISSLYNSIVDVPILGILFSEALVCSWLPFFFFLNIVRTKSRRMLVVLVPYALVLLSLICGPISLVRYCAPVVFGAFALLALLIAISNNRKLCK